MPDVDKWLVGKNIVKIIHISNRLLNFVISWQNFLNHLTLIMHNDTNTSHSLDLADA
jgi:hypothetical protein